MDHEDSLKVVKIDCLEPKTPIANDPDSISSFVVDSSDSSSEDDITLSPLCKGYTEKLRIDCDLVSDEEIIESMHQNLLRLIVSMQIRCFNVGIGEIYCFDGCKTPPLSHGETTNMEPDTCPGAPMKLTKITRSIDSGLRRKLF